MKPLRFLVSHILPLATLAVIFILNLIFLPQPLALNEKATILSNTGLVLDPNFYFFANHPRERLGVTEQVFLSPLLLPIFLIGLPSITFLILLNFLIPATFFILFYSPLSAPSITLIPFFALTIILGLINIVKVIKK